MNVNKNDNILLDVTNLIKHFNLGHGRVLKAVDDEQVLMEFNTSTTPCMVKPLVGNSYEYLILPVRIASNY